MYNQIQRLGNPLISEVLLAKRSHPVHGSIGPKDDAATIGPEIVDFRRPAWPAATQPMPTPSAVCCCPTC